MTQPDTETLREELEQFRREKEQIRQLVGQIGGKATAKRDKLINVIFVLAIVSLFSLDFVRHLLGISVSLPPLFALQIGLLLVSIKIIWMIHKQVKIEHFQFWILNSIEFRLNDVSKRMRKIENRLQ